MVCRFKIKNKLELDYLRLTIILVALLIIIFYLEYFIHNKNSKNNKLIKDLENQNTKNTKNTKNTDSEIKENKIEDTQDIQNSKEPTEYFAPYASILTPHTFRSDASHDKNGEKIDTLRKHDIEQEILKSVY